MSRIDEIRARWAAATQGPWDITTSSSRKEEKWRTIRAQGRAVVRVDEFTRHNGGEPETYCGVWIDDADAQAITEAPMDIAFLLAEVERLTNENDVLIQTSAELCDHCNWRMLFPGEPCKNCGRNA